MWLAIKKKVFKVRAIGSESYSIRKICDFADVFKITFTRDRNWEDWIWYKVKAEEVNVRNKGKLKAIINLEPRRAVTKLCVR